MSAIGLFSSPKGPTFGSVEIQAGISESHSRSAMVSKSPIETGSDVADHRRTENVTLSIDGVVSSHNLTALDDLVGIDQDKASVTMDLLIAMFEAADVFQVVTGIRTYDDCVFTSLDINRDKSTGGTDTLHFKATVEQLRFADSDIDLFPVEVAQKPKTPVGAKPTKAAGAAAAVVEEDVSSAFKLFDKGKALVTGG